MGGKSYREQGSQGKNHMGQKSGGKCIFKMM